MAISGGNIKAGRAFVELSTDNSKLNSGLKAAGTAVKGFSLTAKTALMATGIGAAAGYGIKKIASIISDTVAMAFSNVNMELFELNQQFGLTVEEFSKLRYAANNSNTDIETLGKGFAKLNDSIVRGMKGDGGALEQFDKLGLSVEALSRMDVESRFKTLADALRGIADPSQKLNIAQKLLGEDDGRKLMMLLNAGSEGIDKLKTQAEQFGLVIGQDQIERVAQVQAAWNTLWDVVKQGFRQIATQWGPLIVRVLELIISTIVNIMDALKPAIDTLVFVIEELANIWDQIFGGLMESGKYIKIELPKFDATGAGEMDEIAKGSNDALRKTMPKNSTRETLSAAMGTFNPYAIGQAMRVGAKDYKDGKLDEITKALDKIVNNTKAEPAFS